jgi:hypothetical protein
MATEKKHIAVYLDKSVEDALKEFCTANGLESKKGPMYSAAVNKALAQYFKIASNAPSSLPDNTLSNLTDNTLHHIPSTTPDNTLSNLTDNTLHHIPSTTPNNTLDTVLSNTLEQRLAEIEQRLTKKMAEMKEEILGESVA